MPLSFRVLSIRSGSCLNLCKAHPEPHTYIEEVSHSTTWTSWILSMNRTRFYLHQHSNSRWYVFPATHPDVCGWSWSCQHTSVDLICLCLQTQATMLRPHTCQCVCYNEGTLKQFNAPSARMLTTQSTRWEFPASVPAQGDPPSALLLVTNTKARLKHDAHSKKGTKCTHFHKNWKEGYQQARSSHQYLPRFLSTCCFLSPHPSLGMILLSAREDELEVLCDDDKWSPLRLTRRQCGLQRHRVFLLVETHPSFLEILFWDLHSQHDNTALELILGLHDVVHTICCSIGEREYDIFTRARRQYVFCTESSSMDFGRVYFSQLLNVCNHDISFSRLLPQPMHIREISLARLSYQIGGTLTGLSKKSTIAPNGMIGPSNGSPNRLSWALEYFAESNSIPWNQPTLRFSPKPDCNNTADVPSFILRAHCSVGDPIRPGSMRCRSTMIPW